MKTKCIVAILLLYATFYLHAQQNSCINADFELNNFQNWTAKTGGCCPVGMNASGVIPGRHTIMSGAGVDPHSMGLIPFIPPGDGKYTARLGNDNVGSEAEQLSYSFPVSETSALFVYRYAVVLEDPGHDASQQPRFSIRVYDQLDSAIDCGTYNVVASANIPGFINNGDYRIKPWTTVGIDLSSCIGQTVTIEFTTADCGMGGHSGYAYLECYGSPFKIIPDVCSIGNNIVLNAPLGFPEYAWSNGDTTAAVTVERPNVETIYTCTMTSVTGCEISLSITLQPEEFHAAFYTTGYTTTDVTLMDSSYVIAGAPITQWLWSFGDGAASSHQNPVHSYAEESIYTIRLVAVNEDGCMDTVTKEIIPQQTSYFPSAFSPNADGKNDFFYVQGAGMKNYRLLIFDRYGETIFSTNNPGSSWNGTYKNHPASDGVYVYKASFTDVKNKEHELKGTISMIR